MKSFPEMFCIWATKHVSHFQGTNQQLSCIDKLVLNVCPSCKCHDKSTSHITQCQDPGRACTLKDLVEKLVQWLCDQQTDGKVVHLFKQYLLAVGTPTLTFPLEPNSRLGVDARYHDCLGWDCFLEGQLCAFWVEHRTQHIQRANLMQLADFWAQGLMKWLLQTTHAQWAYGNAMVHPAVKEGWRAAAQKTILETMEGFLCTDPEQLLEEHHHLLFSDFAALASGPTKDKLEWISEIDSVLGATSHVAWGSQYAVRTRYCQGHRPIHRWSMSWSWWM
jgi:hypothetical protein